MNCAPRRNALVMGIVAVLGGVADAAAAEPTSASSQAAERLLLDARDRVRSATEVRDPRVALASVMLAAAERLDPNALDVQHALLDLARLQADEQAFDARVRAMFERDPNDAAIAAAWLDTQMRGARSVEERERKLLALFGTPAHGRLLRALAAVELAQVAHERLEGERVTEWLDRAEALQPHLPATHETRWRLLDAGATPLKRLTTGLGLLSQQPGRVDVAWAIGEMLLEAGLPRNGLRLLEYARAGLHAAGLPMSSNQVMLLARAAIMLGDLDEAASILWESLERDPQRVDLAFLLHWVLEARGLVGPAQQVRDALAERFDAVRDPNAWPANEAAQAAWFHLRLDPQPARALMLAKHAYKASRGDPFTQRVYGFALAESGQTDRARELLAPLADRDPFAARRWLELTVGNADAAERRAAVERRLNEAPLFGPAADYVRGSGSTTQPTPTSAPAAGSVGATLAAELRELGLEDPNALLAPRLVVRIEPASPSVAVGEPWRVWVELTNRSAWPTALGSEFGVNPLVGIQVSMEGDRPRTDAALQTVDFIRYAVLAPGQTVRRQLRIDRGPVHRAARQTAQQLQRVELRPILDPRRTEGDGWRAGLESAEALSGVFNRKPVDPSPPRIADLLGRAARGDLVAIRATAGLLSEQQLLALGRVRHQPRLISASELRRTLLVALQHADPLVRAGALEALGICGLDAPLVAAAEARLVDEHWLVRLRALGLLSRQGAAFADVAAARSGADDDPTVRAFASALERFLRVPEAESEPEVSLPE